MTRETMTLNLDNLFRIGTVIAAVAIGYATLTAAVSQKVDRIEFKAESARVAGELDGLRRIEHKVDQIGDRVSAIYCEDKPPGCQ